MRAKVESDHLVGVTFGHPRFEEVQQLPAHDLGSADHAAHCRFVHDDPQFRLGPRQSALRRAELIA